MRLKSETDGMQHPGVLTIDDHHPGTKMVSINNTTQSLPPGTTYNLDIALGNSNFQIARVMIYGPKTLFGSGALWKEAGELIVTRDANEAMGQSFRDAGTFKKVYSVTYSKLRADANLTQKIFDSLGNRYIAVQDAVLTGSDLRLIFRNFFGGSATLWVKGQAILF